MRFRTIPTKQALLRCGLGVVDITPPVGIYHRLFGAAAHERATGIHRPLQADVLALGPVRGEAPLLVRVQMDHAGFVEAQHQRFRRLVSEAAGVAPEQVVLTCSHTHSGGWYVPDRFALPGGELIAPYLTELGEKLQQATRDAVADLAPAVLAYARGRCEVAANRDGWDEQAQCRVCGFNPDVPAADTVTVARITSGTGAPRACLVHYACHPTTLGWESSLISPDYVGALREVVQGATGQPCIYFQGACGDLGPREGFVGDPAVADRNGRWIGYAALAALESLGPPETDFQYQGPVVSGATLGVWSHVPIPAERRAALTAFASDCFTVELPLKPRLDPERLAAEQVAWAHKANAAAARGDCLHARDCRAHAERAKRWLARLKDLPAGQTYPLTCSVHRLGESLWVITGGEPYHWLQRELERRFADYAVLVSPLGSDLQVAYLLPREEYGKGLYEEEPSALAPGCLELLGDALTERIEALLQRPAQPGDCRLQI